MSKISPLNYAFAIGKVRAMEIYLIRPEVFQQAIDSSLGEALRIFVESGLYSAELLHIHDSQDVEEILSKELSNLKKLLGDLLLDKDLLGLIEQDILKSVDDILKTHPSEFLKDYLRYLIDMHNIKSFLRLYILKEPPERLNDVLTYEGFIKKKDLLELYMQDLAIFLNRLEYVRKGYHTVDYAYRLKEAIQRTIKENSFIYLEKAINDFLIQALRPARYLTFGPEPLLAYYFGKRNEINLMRMIILAKLNDISANLVRERLNLVYA